MKYARGFLRGRDLPSSTALLALRCWAVLSTESHRARRQGWSRVKVAAYFVDVMHEGFCTPLIIGSVSWLVDSLVCNRECRPRSIGQTVLRVCKQHGDSRCATLNDM